MASPTQRACQWARHRRLILGEDSINRCRQSWTVHDSYGFIATFVRSWSSHASVRPYRNSNSTFDSCACHRNFENFQRSLQRAALRNDRVSQKAGSRRHFHDYFLTHLPSSSLHPDSRSQRGPHHKLPRAASTPHTFDAGATASPAAPPPMSGLSRETTVVRIPLQSAKHHFGVSISRGTRPYNEDSHQAGVIEIPAFAKRPPISFSNSRQTQGDGEGTSAESASGDPQVFYFGVFDGHGGAECSGFLRESLHGYVEEATRLFELESSLKQSEMFPETGSNDASNPEDTPLDAPMQVPNSGGSLRAAIEQSQSRQPLSSQPLEEQAANKPKTVELQHQLVSKWSETVGGYFRRFRPEFFSLSASRKRHSSSDRADEEIEGSIAESGSSIETVLTYAFLKADLDFILAQVDRQDEDSVQADKALNEGDILGETARTRGKVQKRFKGGSTCSVAMISTPTPTPFWNPTTPSTLITSHVGDTRILLCSTKTGSALPLTTNHHPSSPMEGSRLRRFAATFVTDSFGEERMSGLANTRAFGDIQSKRSGVSAEPEIRRIDIKPAEYSFLVLMSDGVSGTLTDQEVVDIVKEARTPDQASKDVISFATEVSTEGDNATCMVIRLGGWERRLEGGLGAMGTREIRDWRRQDADNPRSRRT